MKSTEFDEIEREVLELLQKLPTREADRLVEQFAEEAERAVVAAWILRRLDEQLKPRLDQLHRRLDSIERQLRHHEGVNVRRTAERRSPTLTRS